MFLILSRNRLYLRWTAEKWILSAPLSQNVLRQTLHWTRFFPVVGDTKEIPILSRIFFLISDGIPSSFSIGGLAFLRRYKKKNILLHCFYQYLNTKILQIFTLCKRQLISETLPGNLPFYFRPLPRLLNKCHSISPWTYSGILHNVLDWNYIFTQSIQNFEGTHKGDICSYIKFVQLFHWSTLPSERKRLKR